MAIRIAARTATRSVAAAAARCQCSSRGLASTSAARAISEFKMPSMSPTMETGKISSWKVKEGDAFAAGDVIVSIETDKAEVDVEAQEDGIMGKILVDEKASSIEVGRTIALLAEEGDDISNLEAPAESPASSKKPDSSASESSTSSTAAITGSTSPSSSSQSAPSQEKQANKADTASPKSSSHVSSSPSTASPPTGSGSASESEKGHGPTRPQGILPSVLRLLTEAGITDTSGIKATGKSGRLTKGDILVHLGRIADPSGSAKELESMSREKMEIYQVNHDGKSSKTGADAVANQKKGGSVPILSGDEFRRWIVAGLGNVQKQAAQPAGLPAAPLPILGFDDILEGYVPSKKANQVDARPPKAMLGSRDPWNDILGL